MTYGIGRIPADIDVAAEAVAEAIAEATMISKRQPDYPQGRYLGCGCVVYYQIEVMNASMGTSCANCFDRMSD